MTTTSTITPASTTLADNATAREHRGAVARLAATAIAAAVSMGATLLTPAPAHASPPVPLAPGCDNYQFKGGMLQLSLDNGATVQIPANGQSVGNAPRPMYAILGRTEATFGTAQGGISGRRVDVSVDWDQDPGGGIVNSFTGDVKDDGHASGIARNSTASVVTGWHTNDTLSCATPPPAPAPAPAPMPKLPPPTPPTDAISVNFESIASGLRVNVNNASSVKGTCTYDATAPNSFIPPFHKDFTVAPNGGARFDITGFATGTEYNTVTVCHGDYFGQDVQIGRVELTKRF